MGPPTKRAPSGSKCGRASFITPVIRDASRTEDASLVSAHIYESELDGSRMREVLSFGMDYARGRVSDSVPIQFQAWRDDTSRTLNPPGIHDHAFIYPMPMLVDIEFGENEEMIIGVRDRLGDMSLYARNRNLPPGERSGHPFGDILMAERDGDAWHIEPLPEHFFEDAGGGHNATGGFHIDTGFWWFGAPAACQPCHEPGCIAPTIPFRRCNLV